MSICNLHFAICVLQFPVFSQIGAARAAEPAWIDVRQVGPFVCQATFRLDDYQPLLAQLPELQKELSRTLGVPAARQPIHVYLFADARSHEQYVTARFPKIPYRQALFVQSESEPAVYAHRHPEWEIDLRHECTHALLHAVLAEVPLWLDEGLAEYFEMPPTQRAFDHPNFASLRWQLRLGMVRPVEELEGRRELTEMTALDYRYSWAWVHFMLHGPEAAHGVLVDYLADQRQPADAAHFSQRLNTAVPNSSERLVQHFKHWRK
jgi:hypothetical protein